MNVLIIEDEQMEAVLLKTLCESGGWSVRVAQDAIQGVMFAGRDPQPDVVLLDLHLPAGNGRKVLERLKASVRTSRIPVIVVSGSVGGDPALEKELLQLGVSGMVGKPVNPYRLLPMMQQVVKESAGGGE